MDLARGSAAVTRQKCGAAAPDFADPSQDEGNVYEMQVRRTQWSRPCSSKKTGAFHVTYIFRRKMNLWQTNP